MKNVLIVDDQAEIRELVHMTLELEDLQLHEAPSADAAWQLLPRLKPHLLLLDVMMPGQMDGLALCRAIKADARYRGIKVLMLSARNQASDQAAGRAAGADGYLCKPFSPRQLLDVVNRLI